MVSVGFYQTALKQVKTQPPDHASTVFPYLIETLRAQSAQPSTHPMLHRHWFRFAIVLSSTVYPHWVLQSVSCLQTGLLYPLQMNRWSSGSGTGAIWTGIKGCVKFLHAWSMGLNGGVGGGWGLTLGRGRNRNRGGERELASNGSLMRDGQRGLYLITNQHSFEFSREGKCKL